MSGEERQGSVPFRFELPANYKVDQVQEVPAAPDVDIAAAMAAEVPTSISLPPAGKYLVLTPGEDLTSARKYGRRGSHLIALSSSELVMVNGIHKFQFRIPAARRRSSSRQKHPLATRLVSVFVHHREIGPISQGLRLVYAIDRKGRLLGTVDVSDSWPLRTDRVAQLCQAAGMAHSVESFANVKELVAAHPDWAAPVLEFEVNHPLEEETREWAEVFYMVAALAIFLGGTGTFLLSPLGAGLRAAILAASVVSFALTGWAMSRRRMRRSLARNRRRSAKR